MKEQDRRLRQPQADGEGSGADQPIASARTDRAWERLMQAMEQEPISPAWAELERQAEAQEEALRAEKREQAASLARIEEETNMNEPMLETKKSAGAEGAAPRARRMGGRARRWMAGVAAAAVVVTAVATPMGNKALAALLGQFRMEQVTEVNEADLQQLFNSVFQEGVSEEAVNRYGEFKVETGSSRGEMGRQEAEQAAGFALLPESLTGKQDKIYLSASQNLSLKLDVEEINATMKQLGATKLFPASVDGKKLTLAIGPSVSYSIGTDSMSMNVQQLKTPVVDVEAGVDLEDAVETVLKFPLMPEQLKQSLSSSQLLTNGELPLPVFTDEDSKAERLQIGGVPVIVTERHYGEDSFNKEATFVKDGVMTVASMYQSVGDQGSPTTREQADAWFSKQLEELVGA
ncbi:hypothetical protein HGI30_02610 [Paenibacillus albicereus]|uniref:DUF4367 domain-containing protein n=1 Tax=Paenibacillus albicereus TaxID=2726185 RepID=A0A6H2GT69_9BACL|nr:hypothetical protein [Paenibacillus albicereus]QJC50592.1 hypothetical protein HGI30_02610 [Paenibacillus albicereus]